MRLPRDLKSSGTGLHWWYIEALCARCLRLQRRHDWSLLGVIATWEEQGRKCYCCDQAIGDPRIGGRGVSAVTIDHDHDICPQVNHSCKRCRRGLARRDCNSNKLATRIRLGGLPEDKDLDRWLRSLELQDLGRLMYRASCVTPTSHRE